MVREIPLTRGKVALVSDEDYERVAVLKWSAVAVGNYWYARHATMRGGIWKAIKMHRFILDAPDGVEVDHINHDPLDNRRENLRFASRQQNAWNQKVRGDNATGYKGVFQRTPHTFTAYIQQDGKLLILGSYRTPEKAARVHDAMAVILRGEFACPNFPEIDPNARAIAERIHRGERPTALDKATQILTDDDVRTIRRRYAEGGVLLRDLAHEYQSCIATIGHAIRGTTFSHITDPAPMNQDKRRKVAA